MKTYKWNPRDRSVIVVNGSRRHVLHHWLRHSPVGFMCGYGGSGPADLARSLLYDCLGSARWREVEDFYQEFKWSVVALKDHTFAWTITSDEIEAWLAGARACKTSLAEVEN